jgi:hypothetical protein
MNIDIQNLSAGTKIEITYAPRSSTSPMMVRVVTVESVASSSVYTNSGRVRPGHIAGGRIYECDGQWYYQPTMQQPSARVSAMRCV